MFPILKYILKNNKLYKQTNAICRLMGTGDIRQVLYVSGNTKGEPLSPEELKKFLEYSEELAIKKDNFSARVRNLRNAILIRLLALTGRRIGELLAIRIKDIDFENGLISTIIEKRKGAVKKIRPISVEKFTLNLIIQYIELKKLKKNDLLLGISDRQAERIVKQIAKKLNVKKRVTPHSFRHGLITYLRKLGWNTVDIAKVTGHARAETIERSYDHTSFYDVQSRFEEGIKNLLKKD